LADANAPDTSPASLVAFLFRAFIISAAWAAFLVH
jgi:hypothetical protein